MYGLGQRVQVNFSCADGAFAPGLSYCGAPADGPGGPSTPQYLPTGTVGAQTLTVSAQSKDGQTTTQTISYTVVAPAAAGRLLAAAPKGRLRVSVTVTTAGQPVLARSLPLR